MIDSSVGLTIVGFVISSLLGLNAFLIKGLTHSINELKNELVRVATSHDNTMVDVKDNKVRIFELEKESHQLRERVYALEIKEGKK